MVVENEKYQLEKKENLLSNYYLINFLIIRFKKILNFLNLLLFIIKICIYS